MSNETPASDAPEQSTPEVSQPVPGKSPVKKKSVRYSVVRLEKRVTATFSIMAKAFVIVLITVALVFIVRELSESGYVITQVNVPPAFEEAGYSGPVVAKRISENLTRIINITRTQAIAEGYSVSGDENDVSVDMVGMGVPVRGVIDLIGEAVGISRKKKISADITLEGDLAVLVVKVGNEAPERAEIPLDTNGRLPVKALVNEASEAIFKYTNDQILSLYLSNVVLESEKNIRLCKYQLEKCKNDPHKQARIYARWGVSLINLNKLDMAHAKLQQAVALDSLEFGVYSALASYYFAQNQYSKALLYSKKSYALLPADTHDFRRFNGLVNLGFYYSFNNQSDSAIAYYNRALEVDPTGSRAFYNLSYEYLVTGDTSTCLELVEKALANGLGTPTLKKDPDMAPLLNDPRVKEMLLKYDE